MNWDDTNSMSMIVFSRHSGDRAKKVVRLITKLK